MAKSTGAPAIANWRGFVLAVGFALLPTLNASEVRLTFEQLAARNSPDYSPAHLGENVVVRGVVSLPAVHFADYTLLPLQAGSGAGLVKVAATDPWLDRFHPGDEVEVAGKVAVQYGLPVVEPQNILVVGHKPVPAPLDLTPDSVQDLRYLGRLTRIQGTVAAEPAHNAGGAVVVLSALPESYKIFVPRAPGQLKANLNAIRVGDVVRVTGIALQYAPVAPHNTGFELLIRDIGDIIPIERAGELSPPLIAVGIGLVLTIVLLLWSRERRLRAQRRKLRRTYQLGEEILGAGSAPTILKRLSESLPAILGVTRVQLYLYNRAAKTLDAIAEEGGERESISLSTPPGRNTRGSGRLFPLPHLAGGAGYRPQPVPDRRRGRAEFAEEPAVRAHDGAGRRGRRARDGPGRSGARFQPRRTGAGAAPGQPDRRGDPPAGPAQRAGAALPHGKAGCGRPADFGRRQRTADAAGFHPGPGQPRARKSPRRTVGARDGRHCARSRQGRRHGDAPGVVRLQRTGRKRVRWMSTRCCAR